MASFMTTPFKEANKNYAMKIKSIKSLIIAQNTRRPFYMNTFIALNFRDNYLRQDF